MIVLNREQSTSPVFDAGKSLRLRHIVNEILADFFFRDFFITTMQVVILAAGRGTRMHHFTEKCQKTMLPLHGEPLLATTINRFEQAGFKEFILVVGYRKEDIVEYFERKSNIQYVEQNNIKGGTADAVRIVEDKIKGNFVLVYGDVVPSQETVRALSLHFASGKATMAVRTVSDPQRYGVVELNAQGFITRIHEKCANPPSNVVNAGLYVLPASIFECIRETPLSERGEYELTTSIEMWIKKGGQMTCCPVDERSLDIGTIEEYTVLL